MSTLGYGGVLLLSDAQRAPGAHDVGQVLGVLIFGAMAFKAYKNRAAVLANLRRMLPFILVAIASSAFTAWLFSMANDEMLRLAIQEQAHRMEDMAKLSERIDKVMFTKTGDFRFPDLTNAPKWDVRSGRKVATTMIDYRGTEWQLVEAPKP